MRSDHVQVSLHTTISCEVKSYTDSQMDTEEGNKIQIKPKIRWKKCDKEYYCDLLEWPSLEDRRLKYSLTFFYKIHSGTVSLDKDKYLTPAPRLRPTRVSHDSQYIRYMSYRDALNNSFFPRTIFHCGIVFLLQWSHLRPRKNLRLLYRTKGPEVYVLVCLCLASLASCK